MTRRNTIDIIGRFLEERTAASPYASVQARKLFGAWSAWCRTSGEAPGSEVIFARVMGCRGVDKVKRVGIMTYLGFGLTGDGDESPK